MYEGSGPHPILMPERLFFFFRCELLAPTPTISAPDGLHPRGCTDCGTLSVFVFFFFSSYQLFDSAAELSCAYAFPFWFWWHLGRDLRIIHPNNMQDCSCVGPLPACQVGNISHPPKPKTLFRTKTGKLTSS